MGRYIEDTVGSQAANKGAQIFTVVHVIFNGNSMVRKILGGEQAGDLGLADRSKTVAQTTTIPKPPSQSINQIKINRPTGRSSAVRDENFAGGMLANDRRLRFGRMFNLYTNRYVKRSHYRRLAG